MNIRLDKSRPICPQICEYLCASIAKGDIEPNQRLLSVREVALNIGVNPNTVQKAMEQLESKGVIYSVRGSGWFVSENTATAVDTVKEIANLKTKQFILEMENLGFTLEDILNIIKEWEE